MNLDAVKKSFFDTKVVIDALAPEERKRLAQFGAFTRQRARTSIRTRKAVSKAGEPPSSHTGAIKRNIFFSYDLQNQSVVIGPVLAGSRSGAPEDLEKGGETRVRTAAGVRTVPVAPRPYMRPAFEAELEKVDNQYRNLIKR